MRPGSTDTGDEATLGGERIAVLHDEEERICDVCWRATEENYHSVGHVMSAHEPAICEAYFDGRKTWMVLADRSFDD